MRKQAGGVKKSLTVTVTFEFSDAARRALRFRTGDRGLATAKELDDYVHMCVNASFEDLGYDYENRPKSSRKTCV